MEGLYGVLGSFSSFLFAFTVVFSFPVILIIAQLPLFVVIESVRCRTVF